MKQPKLMFAGLSLLLLWTITATAVPKQKEQALKVGKRGEITLNQPTKVDGITLSRSPPQERSRKRRHISSLKTAYRESQRSRSRARTFTTSS